MSDEKTQKLIELTSSNLELIQTISLSPLIEKNEGIKNQMAEISSHYEQLLDNVDEIDDLDDILEEGIDEFISFVELLSYDPMLDDGIKKELIDRKNYLIENYPF